MHPFCWKLFTIKKYSLGAEIHNVEFQPGSGGQLARSAGTLVEIKEGNFVTVRLPSKEIRLVSKIVGLQLVK
jgi:large subunit ribosomal protein L2